MYQYVSGKRIAYYYKYVFIFFSIYLQVGIDGLWRRWRFICLLICADLLWRKKKVRLTFADLHCFISTWYIRKVCVYRLWRCPLFATCHLAGSHDSRDSEKLELTSNNKLFSCDSLRLFTKLLECLLRAPFCYTVITTNSFSSSFWTSTLRKYNY